MITVIKNNKFNVVARADPGINQTVKSFTWYLDGVNLNNNSYNLMIDTIPLVLGVHLIRFEATNLCGNSGNAELQFNLVEVNNMQQTDTINVNKTPTMVYSITLRRKSDVTINVKDDPNGLNPNAPVVGATVSLNTTPTATSGTTDAAGNVILQAVPLGTYAVTTIFT